MLILNPLSGSGMYQPTVRRAVRERLIDVREVRTGYWAEALSRPSASPVLTNFIRDRMARNVLVVLAKPGLFVHAALRCLISG